MLQSKFQASLGYRMRPGLRKTKASESFGVRWSGEVSLEELYVKPWCEAPLSSRAWWPVSIVLALWRQKQAGLESKVGWER